MILADVNAWARFVIRARTPDADFARLVEDGEIVVHPWIVGEMALGGARPDILQAVMKLDQLPVAPYAEVMAFIRRYRPVGIGWVDVNLLVSALDAGADLLTFDNELHRNAELHGRAARPS